MAGGIAAVVGPMQWFYQMGSYNRAISRTRRSLIKEKEPAVREQLQRQLKTYHDEMPTPWDCTYGIYEALKP